MYKLIWHKYRKLTDCVANSGGVAAAATRLQYVASNAPGNSP